MKPLGLRSRLLVGLALLQVVFADRLALQVNTGGRGVISAMAVSFPFLVAALLLPNYRRALVFLKASAFQKIWMPVILCAFFLPILGVAFQDYPLHSLYTSWEAILELAFLALGAWGASRPGVWDLARSALLFSIVAQAALGVIQVSPLVPGLGSWAPLQPILDWDSQFKMTFIPDNLVLARGTGFYLNPNALGVWSCLAFWASITFFRGRRRVLGCSASIVSLLVCQSRGSMFALVASLIVYGMIRPWKAGSTQDRRKWLKRLIVAAGASSLMLVVIAAVMANADQFADTSFVGSMLSRLGTGVQVLSQGAGADSNFLGRVQVWSEAWDYFLHHPFGTFGSPQLVLGLALDSEYMRVLLQGGLVFLTAYAGMLLGGISYLWKHTPCGLFIALASVCLAVNSISATPLTYTAIGFFWIIVGGYLGSQYLNAPLAAYKKVQCPDY